MISMSENIKFKMKIIPSSIFQVISDTGSIFQPPKRISVAEGAKEYVKVPTTSGWTSFSPDVTPYMVEPMNLVTSRDYQSIIFVGPARSGKALPLDTEIATPDGFKTMGDLRDGDYVFDRDGKPSKIISTTDVMHDHKCYEVEFSSGEKIACDAEHLWTVREYDPSGVFKSVKTIDTETISKSCKFGRRSRYRVENAKPLQFERKDLLIDPYIVGYWLGDGNSSQAMITAHKDDSHEIKKALIDNNHTYDIRVQNASPNVEHINIDRKAIEGDICFRGHDKRIVGTVHGGWCKECRTQNRHKRVYGHEQDPILDSHQRRLSLMLRKDGLISSDEYCVKHIPRQYMEGSVDQRLSLLQGLMDSDGSIDKRSGSCEFTSSIKTLAYDTMELINSLGIRASISHRYPKFKHKGVSKVGKKSYRILFKADKTTRIFRLERKYKYQESLKDSSISRLDNRSIVNVQETHSVPVKCIGVDNPDNLYLVGRSFIPTHNSLSMVNATAGFIIMCDPSDMLILLATDEMARKYSRQQFSRMIENSPALRDMLSKNAHDDNLKSKHFRSGTAAIIGNPTSSTLSGMSYKYVFFNDYDRMEQDNGEGDVFGQGLKRTQTFLSAGMTVVESSPGRDFTDVSWKPKSLHEAPPVGGILGLYNSGDRRIYYWDCPSCHTDIPLRPGLELFMLPDQNDIIEMVKKDGAEAIAGEYAHIYCPHCGSRIEEKDKNKLNKSGVWIPERDVANKSASFWLSGVTAKFQSWTSILEREFSALLHMKETGDESRLKATRNTDQGIPHIPFGATQVLTPEDIARRAEDTTKKRFVPKEVRFLMASIDVQKNKFVVYVEGFGVGLERWAIDRFDILMSRRKRDEDFLPIEPASYKEDWLIIIDEVIEKRYRTSESNEREMGITMTVCDSGGKAGTTENAYGFWKECKKLGLDKKFALIKGYRATASSNKGMVSKTMLDKTSSAARKAKVVGELPLWILNSTLLKDALYANLKREYTPGVVNPDYIHFPDWFPFRVYEELCVETRTEKGWEPVRKASNEQFDLMHYTKAAFLIKMHSFWRSEIDWDSPPAWAAPWDDNSEVRWLDESYRPIDVVPAVRSRTRVKMKR